MRFLTFLALGAVHLAPGLASAEQPRTHDGFYLRLAGGVAIHLWLPAALVTVTWH